MKAFTFEFSLIYHELIFGEINSHYHLSQK